MITGWRKAQQLRSRRGAVRPLYVVLLVLLAGLLVVSYLLWHEWSQRFPLLAPGAYMGSLFGALGAEADGRSPGAVNFYVEKAERSDDLLFVVLRAGWKPQIVSGIAAGSSAEILPVVLTGEDGKYTFTGTRAGPDSYAGRFWSAQRKGGWKLVRIPAEGLSPDAQSLKELKLRLLLRDELAEVEAKILEAETAVPAQRKEIERLTAFVTEGDRLRAKANEKYAAVHAELRQTQQTLKERRDEARKLTETLRISQKLPGSGKLVALARESLEREGRWIDSMLKSSHSRTPEDVEEALARGEKILAIKREIAAEKGKIEALERGEGQGEEPLDDGQTR